MFRFSKQAKLRHQLHETIAFIHKRIRIDRDLMTARDIALLHTAADEAAMDVGGKQPDQIERDLKKLNDLYEKIFPPRKDHWLRENGEILLVAILVAMAFRAYFLQPFRIPTGSMQPTLYGIDVQKRMAMTPGGEYIAPPGLAQRLFERVILGRKYVFIHCKETGRLHMQYQQWGSGAGMFPEIYAKSSVLEGWPGPVRLLLGPVYRLWRWVSPASEFKVGNVVYTVPVAREQLWKMFHEMKPARDWEANPVFKEGEMILNFTVISGDHLFVDRFSYNFTRPKRGDIFVFETRGINVGARGQFYIKRCVGLPGETIRISDDDRLVVNDEPVPATGPFAKIYSKKDGYWGHLNFKRLHEARPDVVRATDESRYYLLNERDSFTLPPDGYWAMGDNTRESRDSRYFGPVPERNLVGKAFFVYWPFGKRWGAPE